MTEENKVTETKETEEKVSLGILEKMANIFKSQGATQPAVKAQSEVDVDALVQQKINELIPEIKKSEKATIEEEKAALAKQKEELEQTLAKEKEALEQKIAQEKAELEQKKKIDELVDENYKEFVKYVIKNENKTLEQVLEENIIAKKSQTSIINTNSQNIEKDIIDLVRERRKKRGFK